METLGLRVWGMAPRLMSGAHIHTEIEFNLVLSGSLVYLFGGQSVRIQAGQLAVFWASVPHQITDLESETHGFWATLPLVTFWGFGLAPSFVQTILGGAVVTGNDRHGGARDALSFADWEADLKDQTQRAEREKIVLLGLESRLRRLALSLELQNAAPRAGAAHLTSLELGRVEKMAAFMAQNFARDLGAREIAASANLNPNYATTLFKQEFGFGLHEFLARTRLAHAQRLLVSTPESVTLIGEKCGFGSPASFHAAFKKAFGQSPAKFRAEFKSN